MKVLVSADMEGVTGVVHPDDVEPGSASHGEFRHLMTADVNAAVAGLFDGGATTVVVNDAHSSMRNLVLSELDPRVSYVRGSPKPLGMMQGLYDASGEPVDAVAFVGYHAGAGQPGVLAHCHLAGGIVDVRIDGTPASEGRMNALLAAEAGATVVLVTGDDLACRDAQAYAPQAATAEVKRAIDRFAAEVLPPERSAAVIREAAARGLSTAGAAVPPPATATWEVELDGAHLAVAAARIPGVRLVEPRSVQFTGQRFAESFQVFRLLATVVGATAHHSWG